MSDFGPPWRPAGEENTAVPSVHMIWSGRCDDHAAQDALTGWEEFVALAAGRDDATTRQAALESRGPCARMASYLAAGEC